MKNVRTRTRIALGIVLATLALIPLDWRVALVVGCVGVVIGALSLWTAE